MSTDTSPYASLDDLIASTTPDNTADVDLPGGGRVKVRGLTRYELLLNVKGTDDALLVERRNVAACLVEPKMTVAQVERWQRASTPDVLGAVTLAIRNLSGLGEGAQKSGVPGDGDDA